METFLRANGDRPDIISPLRGKLVAVPTVQETNPSFAFGNAYAVEIIQKSASQVIKVLDKEFLKDPSLPVTHLRRFVKWEFLPVRVREQIQIQIQNEAEAENEKRGDGSGSAVEEGPLDCVDDDDEEEEEEEERGGELSHEQSSRLARQARQERQERQGTIYVLIPPPVLDDLTQLKTLLAPFAPGVVSSPEEKAQEQGQEQGQKQHAIDVPVYNVTIPLQPPLNSQQAESWSKTYWPTIFNAAASRGMVAPPPKILETTQSSLEPRAGYYLALAGRVAREAKLGGRGRGIGVVVVDPALAASSTSSAFSDCRNSSGEDDAVVAVAGDARYCARGASVTSRLDREDTDREEETTQEADRGGGPEFHAMMRAIEMVATRRRDDKLASTTTQTQTQTSSTIYGTTLSSLETYYLCRPASSSQYPTASTPADADTTPNKDNASRILPRSAGGYLCTDLDVYITHEPCLACSMGMLLSRFRTITFPRRGRLGTGGLASQDSREMCSSSIDASNRSDGNDHTDNELQSIDTSGDGTRVESTRVQRGTYYGLHWRKELNWRAMCFEFIEDADQGYYDGEDGIEAVGDYHA